jgi:hypothetical protein
VVKLTRPAFRAIGVVRDPDGTGRIRLTVVTTTRCGGSARRRVELIPPAQIERVAIAPGVPAPVERQRSAEIRLDTRAGCSITGEVMADGTDAHGRDAVTGHIAFAYGDG